MEVVMIGISSISSVSATTTSVSYLNRCRCSKSPTLSSIQKFPTTLGSYHHHRRPETITKFPSIMSKLRTTTNTLASSSRCYYQAADIQNSNTTITQPISISDDVDDDELIVDGAGERITSSEHEEEDEDEESAAAMAGLVKRLECLEEEALSMGTDNGYDSEGREPTDYNRRAQMFDKCSQVFQAMALKNTTTTTT